MCLIDSVGRVLVGNDAMLPFLDGLVCHCDALGGPHMGVGAANVINNLYKELRLNQIRKSVSHPLFGEMLVELLPISE